MSDLSERLRISAMHGTYDGTGECHATASDVAEAADEIERLRADAARYRWLMDNHAMDVAACAWGTKAACKFGADQVDQAVDAAMRSRRSGRRER